RKVNFKHGITFSWAINEIHATVAYSTTISNFDLHPSTKARQASAGAFQVNYRVLDENTGHGVIDSIIVSNKKSLAGQRSFADCFAEIRVWRLKAAAKPLPTDWALSTNSYR